MKRKYLIDDEQKEQLLKIFFINPYPTNEQHALLATSLELEISNVKNWFKKSTEKIFIQSYGKKITSY